MEAKSDGKLGLDSRDRLVHDRNKKAFSWPLQKLGRTPVETFPISSIRSVLENIHSCYTILVVETQFLNVELDGKLALDRGLMNS